MRLSATRESLSIPALWEQRVSIIPADAPQLYYTAQASSRRPEGSPVFFRLFLGYFDLLRRAEYTEWFHFIRHDTTCIIPIMIATHPPRRQTDMPI
ncbi:hypothetical protein ElyMa_005008000 [Elysia marginata]|uniref:Uncharacterized protein n=1 Tax=Elysia marginata TaxID=1093978 RepID=A0AAV4J937_9GAST|nr:hypothetical protein ElyMa_005008000 [Elysia marginata]